LEAEAPEEENTPVKKKKPRMRRTKLGKYEFTNAQLEIAYRSLNAGGSV